MVFCDHKHFVIFVQRMYIIPHSYHYIILCWLFIIQSKFTVWLACNVSVIQLTTDWTRVSFIIAPLWQCIIQKQDKLQLTCVQILLWKHT